MGDKKPKKNSSGNSDAHKAKLAKNLMERPHSDPRTEEKAKNNKK
jgi:hypothetical protein